MCMEAEEFLLLRSMLMAAAEERYDDAGKLNARHLDFISIVEGMNELRVCAPPFSARIRDQLRDLGVLQPQGHLPGQAFKLP